MKQKEIERLREQIAASPRLQRLEEQLQHEVQTRLAASPDHALLDPITILMIISIIIQVVRFCQERNQRTDAEIVADLRNAPQVAPRRSMRMRRRLKTLWRTYCDQHHLEYTEVNPFLSAAYAVSAAMDDDTVAELVTLARR